MIHCAATAARRVERPRLSKQYDAYFESASSSTGRKAVAQTS
jgi:hypothetical protein